MFSVVRINYATPSDFGKYLLFNGLPNDHYNNII
jgi:hypothetical protein